MPHVLPPYRADVVGSFLRPAAVAQARAAFARGELSREALTAVEDEEIAALVKKELDNGLTAVTDGEFRRAFWHLDFLAGLKGIRHVKAEAWSVHFEGRQPKAETVVIEDRLSFPADHPFLEAFDRLKKIAGDAAVKYTIPSPSMLHLICCVRATDYEPIAAYKDNEELLLDDLAQTWTDAMLALYERGCRYLQLDDTSWGEFCSAEKRAAYAARGIDVDAVARSYVGVLNRIIAAKPADLTLTMHICRGNFRSTWFSSGGYEPIELPRRRLLPRVRQRALGRIRAAALHQGPDGRPRPHHLQVPRTRGQGGRQGPHRRSSEVRSARTALSLSAVRLLLDRGRQHHDRGGTVGQGPSRGRDRPRGLAGRVTDFPA